MSFDRKKPYNDLKKIPPLHELETKEVLKQAIKSSRALAELKLAGKLLPDQTLLINSLVLLEAKDSSEIESIFTTHDKLYQADLLHEIDHDSQTKEVTRYREALWNGAVSMNKRPLGTNVFLEIVQTIKQNTSGIRTGLGTQIVNPLGEIIYTPPEGEKLLRDLLQNLETFIHETNDLDPLIKMAIIHYQFEAIHPFSDGNGRTGRILNILYLLQERLLETPVLFLSRYIINNKTEYYKGLQNVTEHAAWENWVLYMLKAVEETAVETVKRIESILRVMQFYNTKMANDLPKIHSKDLLELMFEHPYCRIQGVAKKLNISRQTAASYLNQLTEINLLIKDKIRKEVIYLNPFLIKELSK